MKNLIFLILVFLTVCLSNALHAQEDASDQTLKSQFDAMLESSETYTEYKVVRKTKLNDYSRAVQDSLSKSRSEIIGLKNEVTELKSQVRQLTTRISDLEAQLDESESLRDSLTFLGINMNKTTYHSAVWFIIITLAVFGVFAYTSFMRSNQITSKTKKEMTALEVEYEEHKKKSQEKQIKMGRELQTERNLVEELKTKLKAKTPTTK